MHEQMRKTLGQSDSFFPTMHEGDDPETRYRTRRRDDDKRFRIEAMPDLLASEAKPRNVNITVDEPRIRSIEWSLRMPDGRVSPDVVRTKAGDPDATTRPFRLEQRHLSTTGSYTLECTGLDSSGSLVLVAFRDFRIVGTNQGGVKNKSGTLAFLEYTATKGSVRTKLGFVPNPGVTCPEIGWIQAVQALDTDGESIYRYMKDPVMDARKTPLSWAIDRGSNPPSPFYGTVRDPKTGTIGPDPQFTQFGGIQRADPTAVLADAPEFQAAMVTKYESCAVCRSGADAGTVYGCAMWGFTSKDDGTATLHPQTISSKPSPKFAAAAGKWNEWREGLYDKPEAAPTLRTP